MTGVRQRRRERPVLTRGAIGPQLVRLALPMVAGILAMLAFNMVDTFFVGRLGTRPLAAMALTFPVVMVVTSLSLGLSVSTSIAVSQLLGGGDEGGARRVTTDAMGMAFILGLGLMIAGYLGLKPLLCLLGASPETCELAAHYLRIWFAGVPLLTMQMTGNMAVRATGDTLTTGFVLMGGMLLNAVLDPFFIFGWAGIPAMGIRGAAWATVFARALTLACGITLLLRDGLLERACPTLRMVVASWVRILRNGVPIALNNLVSPFTLGAMTWMVTRVAEEAVAGYGVAGRVESLLLVTIFSLQSVVGIFIGQNSGAGRWDRVRRCARLSGAFSVLWGVFVFALLAVVGRRVAGWFNPDMQVTDTAYWYFALVGGTFGVRGIYFVFSACLNSLNRASWATVLTVVKGGVVNIPISWFLGQRYGVVGIFAGIAAGNVIGSLLATVLLRRALASETVPAVG